jgi:hypothetical protein
LPSTTRGLTRLRTKKNPQTKETANAPQNTAGSDPPVPGTPNAPRMSMIFAMKNDRGMNEQQLAEPNLDQLRDPRSDPVKCQHTPPDEPQHTHGWEE